MKIEEKVKKKIILLHNLGNKWNKRILTYLRHFLRSEKRWKSDNKVEKMSLYWIVADCWKQTVLAHYDNGFRDINYNFLAELNKKTQFNVMLRMCVLSQILPLIVKLVEYRKIYRNQTFNN